MNNFKSGGFKRGGRDFGGRPKFGGGGDRGGRQGGGFRGGDRGGRSREQSELFSTVCDSCHKSCEVPFRPNGDKPVYCRDCFGKKDHDDFSEGRGSRGDFGRRDDRGGRPDLARKERPQHTEAPRASQEGELAEVKQQLKTIESRLNRILDIINPPKAAEEVKEVAVAATSVEAAPKKAAKKAAPKTVKAEAKPKVAAKKAAPKKVAKTAAKKAVKKAK